VTDVVVANLSRLATQWEEIVGRSVSALEKDAIGRVDGLVDSIEKLIVCAQRDSPRIRVDLLMLEELRGRLSKGESGALG
jgi:hypothetical protein